MDVYEGLAHLESRAVLSTAYAVDNSFGPFFQLPGKANFDFTLLFEETILSIGPSALLVLFALPRVLHLWKTPRKVLNSYLLTVKIVRSQAYLFMIALY
jgi:ATP-binding cassette subfamily C (CFTR/MRP) protein 1